MSAKVLSKDVIELVSRLSTIQSQKDTLQERVQLYHKKLEMIHEASLALDIEEQELASKIQELGLDPEYTEEPRPVPQSRTVEQPSTLLSLLQQTSNTSGGIYTFPQDAGEPLTTIAATSPIRARPKTTRTVAPSLNVRRNR